MKKRLSEIAIGESRDGLINPNSSIPMYIQISDHLQSQILNAEIGHEDKLPSEKELGNLYNVSRITVRQALDILEKKGLTFSVQGKGTFAKRSTIDQNLMHIISFGKTLQEKKLQGTTTLFDFRSDVKNEGQNWPPELETWKKACCLELIGMIAAQPAVYYRSYIRQDIGEQIYSIARQHAERQEIFSTFSLYEEVGCRVDHIKQNLFAKEADDTLSDLLKISPGKALMMIESLVYDGNNAVIEYKIAYYRTDRYYFTLLRENASDL